MDILQDLQDYQVEFNMWLGILKTIQEFNSGVNAISIDDGMALATLVLWHMGELSDMVKTKKSRDSSEKAVKIPQVLLGEVFSVHARAAQREEDGDHNIWVQRVANQHFPSNLSEVMQQSTLEDTQMKIIRNRLVDLFRVSGKVEMLVAILKALSRHVNSCGDAAFRTELQKLCKMALITEVDDSMVQDIVKAKDDLIAPGSDGQPPSSWQKALVFLPSGTQLVALVDEEVKQMAKIEGLEMDLKAVEDSVCKWSGDTGSKERLVNTELDASLPVLCLSDTDNPQAPRYPDLGIVPSSSQYCKPDVFAI